MNAEQIYTEIIKRFPEVAYDTEGSMYVFFGKEWGLLNKKAREKAEAKFYDAIWDEHIKGIRYTYRRDEGGDMRDDYGDIVYIRIRNDLYRR